MTLLKAYLLGSNDPFILAKAFLDDMILKDRKAVEERVDKIFSESMGKDFQETLEFWQGDVIRIKNLIALTKKEKQVLHDYYAKYFMRHYKDKPVTTYQPKGGEMRNVETATSEQRNAPYRGPEAREKYGLPKELGRDVEVGPTTRAGHIAELGEEELEWAYEHEEGEEPHFLDNIIVEIPKTTLNKLDAQIHLLEDELKEAEKTVKEYVTLKEKMVKFIYDTQARTNLETSHWAVIENDMIELGVKFLKEEIEILQSVYDSLEIPDSAKWMEHLHEINIKIQENPSPENIKLLEEAVKNAQQQPHAVAEKEKKEIEAKLKELKTRLKTSEQRLKFATKEGLPDKFLDKYRGYLFGGDLDKVPSISDSALVTSQKKKYGEDYGKTPFKTGAATYSSDRWMDIFAGSARTIDNKKAFRRMLSELLESPEIREALDKDVIRDSQTGKYGADKPHQGITSGMARFKTEDGVVQTDHKPKYARPAVRLQNLNKLKSLLESAPKEENQSLINRIIDSINNEIEAEKEILEESESVVPKSKESKALDSYLKQMPNSLRRYRTGKYPHNFITLVNGLKEEGLQLSDVIKLSEGKKITGISENLDKYSDWLQNIVKGTNDPLVKHIKAAWIEDPDDKIDEEDAKLFRDAMYDLIDDTGYSLSNVPKESVPTLNKAKALLSSLEQNFKTFRRLEEEGMTNQEILESMSLEFKALTGMFESIQEDIPEELKEDLANSIETFNEAFDVYEIEVETDTPMDKLSWIKRIAEDAQDFTKDREDIAEGFKNAGISIEGLEHLQSEKMSKEDLEKYVNARLPTVNRTNYQQIKGNKVVGFNERAYKNALRGRKRTIDRIVEGKEINRKDLTWSLPKRKYRGQRIKSDTAFGEELEYGAAEEDLDEAQGIEVIEDEGTATADEIRQRKEQAGAFDE